MNYANTWGLYQCFQGTDDAMVDSECRDGFFALQPNGKVFECISEQGDTITLKYGEQVFRVKAMLYKMIPKPLYKVGDIVEIIDKATEGKILDVNWHIKDNEPFYFIEVNGKESGKGYKDCDIKAVVKNGQ